RPGRRPARAARPQPGPAKDREVADHRRGHRVAAFHDRPGRSAARFARFDRPRARRAFGPHRGRHLLHRRRMAGGRGGRGGVRAPAPDDDPVDYWKPVLTDGDPEVRAIVIDKLAGVPEGLRGGAVDAIADAAADENVKVRRAAMSNLALTKTAKGVAAAIKGLDDPDRAVVLSALKVMAQYKDRS